MNQRLTGNEEFTLCGSNARITVMDFWRWAFSGLADNTGHGTMAEFLVCLSLKRIPLAQTRENWLPFDVTSPSGRHILFETIMAVSKICGTI